MYILIFIITIIYTKTYDKIIHIKRMNMSGISFYIINKINRYYKKLYRNNFTTTIPSKFSFT